MTCCESGKKCHCSLAGSGSNCQSGQCCVVDVSSGKSPAYYHSLKCLIRRLVKFFKDLSLDSSNKNCSKICCEIFCVLKISYFLKDLYNDSKKWAGKECSKCKPGGGSGKNQCNNSKAPSGSCCGGNISKCTAPNCCQGCPDCNAIKLGNALQELQYSGPCGQDLYRVLDSFLQCCCNVFRPYVDSIQGNVKSARDSCPNCGKPGKPAKACECSKSGSCKGCPKLLKDFQLKVTLAGGYFSSYDSSSAKWDSLCPSGSKCCGSSSPPCSCPQDCSSGSPSCPKDCCEKCPKRLCAKIFLGFLPALYYGLKILYERCKDPVTWPTWSQKNGQKILVPASVLDASDLKKFLDAWGFESSHLDPSLQAMVLPGLLGNLFNASFGKFKSLFDFVSEKYFVPSGSLTSHPSKSPPQTVRQMLLWLYGLRFHKHFSDLVSHCKDLCLPFGNSFHPDAFCYYIHTCCFLLPVSVISFIQCPDGSPSFLPSHSDWQNFCYPENPSELFEKFCDLVRKIYIPLHFLKFQCERVPGQGGWRDCYFGLNCKVDPLASTSSSGPSSGCSSCPNSGSYLCTASGQNKDVHKKHCDPNGAGKGCINANGSGKCSDPGHNTSNGQPGKACPHPLLRFLTADSDSKSPSSPFRLPFSFARIDFSKTPPVILEASSDKFLTMGFSPDKLSSTAKSGYSLGHRVLHVFCREDGFYPLTRLLQFSLCVSRYPETLGELFAFFFRFSESDVFKNYFESYVDGEPGWYRGKALQDAVRAFYGAKESHPNSHPFDLYSLIACSSQTGSTCGKYLHPLTYNAYDKNIFIKDFLGTYLSWVCYSAEKFKEKLEKFKKDFEDSCSSCSSGSSCTKIVECPCALPFLYSFGFGFWSPGDLNCVDNEGNSKHGRQGQHTGGNQNCTTKSCSDFLTQLEKVVKGDPFNALLRIIDEFIWSIRLPFIYAFLYIWILVISYFYYVQFYKLDLLHIDSHLHLPRSFKILPSTLFSDASSKLKDLSYFTL
ncbi:variant erythrocyte surface antigen-1 family protein [Babesia divergens]|uniref:Variant erythrocyte surface antigen-1 family protein n=1 Tax=Babesia divergens TaxID=32595 RepID=A0AAD9LG44_BABDI|nr:variant erythrocyte surface antigen-1 family protein [Babesia divergens]